MGPVEAYMVKHGIINPKTGTPYTVSNLDLSEYHLGWFSYTNAYDKLGMLTGDSTSPYPSGSDFIASGGNGMISTMTLMRWTGLASEEESALAYSKLSTNGIDPKYAYNYDVAHVESVDWIPTSNIEAVKRAIMEYGAGSIDICVNGNYFNSSTKGLCFKQSVLPGDPAYQSPNHAVTVIGWDDNFPASNFNSNGGPTHDGAWIVKNSWGSEYPTLYVSYEDSASFNDISYFYQVGNVDNYDNNYQYDGTTCFDYDHCAYVDNGGSFANVFTSFGTETLQAVSICNYTSEIHFQLDIYKNLTDAHDPTSGTKVSSQLGYIEHFGYHTVPLQVPVHLTAGDSFSVVFTITHDSAAQIEVGLDQNRACDYAAWTHAHRENTTFIKGTTDPAWIGNTEDFPCNLRIKAYTDNTPNYVEPESPITAFSNNESFGTVFVTGSTVIANPAIGYRLDHCEVESGSATWTIDGDAIHVNASSDCVLRVYFDEIPVVAEVSVVCVVCGLNYGYETFPQGSRITLPTSVDIVPDGWEFCGWSDQPIEATTEEPNYYAPGSSYILNRDTVLYALYTRSDGSSEVAFQRLTATPDTWEGNYVITYTANPGTMRVLKSTASTSVIGISSSTYAPVLASTGMTLNQDVLTNVSTAYQFTFSAHGGAYWLRNVSTGSFLGGTTVLYACAERYTSFLNWNLSFQNGAPVLKNTYKNSYLSFNTGNGGYFCLTSGTNANICLWKEMPIGLTYYSTDFGGVAHEHTLEYYPAYAPTCEESGNIACYYCSICNGCFLDPEAQQEISMSQAILPALGHNAGEPVIENQVAPTCGTAGSYEAITFCTRCSVELSREQVVIPATNDHNFSAWTSSGADTHQRTCSVCSKIETVACTFTEEVIPPTATEMGYTLHTCTVCGNTFTDCFIAPLGSDYLITFSVPSGVAPVASMTCTPNASITLPTAEAPEGYTFLGWVPTAVSSTEAMPSNILNGTYQPTGDTTLYALYSYTEGSGVVGFQRLTSAPDTWEGNYVITYTANAGTMRVLKSTKSSSVVGISSSTYAPSLASTGITLNQNVLTNVSTAYQFTVSAHDSYYWFQNVSTGSYLGGTTVLYACTERYACFLNWTLSFQNGAPLLCNSYKNSYLRFTSGNGGYFCLISNTNTNISLWKQVSTGGTYYTTIFN